VVVVVALTNFVVVGFVVAWFVEQWSMIGSGIKRFKRQPLVSIS